MFQVLSIVSLSAALVGAQATSSCKDSKISSADRKQFLDYHNVARRRLAKGDEPNRSGYMNMAKNMYKLGWDCELEKKAWQLVQGCPHTVRISPKISQNIMRWQNMYGTGFKTSELVKSTLDSWWKAGQKYGVSPSQVYNQQLYSFANMAYSKATRIGCSYVACGSYYMTISCVYNANILDGKDPIWQTGNSCKRANECTTYRKSGCQDGLCTAGSQIVVPQPLRTIRPPMKPPTTTTKKPKVTPKITKAPVVRKTTIRPAKPPVTSFGCSNAYGMSDEIRRTFLNMHNGFRSSLALGREYDKLIKGNASPAAKMLKMVYNCSIEESAMRNAGRCVYGHSSDYERPGLGENIYQTTAPYLDKIKAATQASQLWWNELKENGVGHDNMITDELWSRPGKMIGHYTQMAWETTYQLGCAIVYCPHTYVVCQYGPSGNYFNEPIYTKGRP
ncbi:SCP-like protein, partial [Oesophagostomum dentatum]